MLVPWFANAAPSRGAFALRGASRVCRGLARFLASRFRSLQASADSPVERTTKMTTEGIIKTKIATSAYHRGVELLEGTRIAKFAQKPPIAFGVNLPALSLELQLHLHQLDLLIGAIHLDTPTIVTLVARMLTAVAFRHFV